MKSQKEIYISRACAEIDGIEFYSYPDGSLEICFSDPKLSTILIKPEGALALKGIMNRDVDKSDQDIRGNVLRDLVDRVWNAATDSQQVPSANWANDIIEGWRGAWAEANRYTPGED